MADQDILEGFAEEERAFVEGLISNNQVLITDNDMAELPAGVTHILLKRAGKKSKLIRKRFFGHK